MPGFVKKCPFVKHKIEEEIRVLDYRHSSLQDIPSEVFNRERTLEELYADSNQIRDLPRELFYCHGLRKLSISDNEITSIPPAISSLANLEELDFSKNGIIDVPDTIKGCKYLRSIDASVNPLGKLPEGITYLTNLTCLYLNDTFLDFLPGSFGRMVTLKILELRENHLKTLPHSFSRLVQLERLDIGNNELTELSDVIGGLKSLLELWCDNNQITTFANNIGNLKHLMFVDGSNNQLHCLPLEIEGCTSLADLHLTSNNLTELPATIGNLNNLTTLKVDDNQLNSLPDTLGGLSSLSELNVSANDLEKLPVSIGLLRNLRTLYADENMLQLIPAEIGSCNGVTVLSLRGNKLTYIPDELGRIPRLRVLNLSDNCLQYLPFSIVKLKELQALWLAENQTRPLIPLQSEYDADTGRKILTCYLLPQGVMEKNDARDTIGDSDSFHASMWDEERLRRQQIHFDFADGSDEEGRLVRCPTPYPKEMREKVRHARNLALRQMISVGDSERQPDLGSVTASAATDRSSHLAGTFDEDVHKNSAYSAITEHSDVRLKEARITRPTSPRLQETHRLYKCDKEKFMKDKIRMQPRLSVPDFSSDVKVMFKDSKNKDQKVTPKDTSLSRCSGSVPDLTNVSGRVSATGQTTSANPASTTYDDLYAKQIANRYRGRRSRRMRDYDSDTGYRSDGEAIHFPYEDNNKSSRGASSEIYSVQSQPMPHRNYNHHQHIPRGREGLSYASDIEGYAGGSSFPTANAAAAAYQRKHHQHHLGHFPAQSMPYNLDTSAQSTTKTPSSSLKNFLSYSPSKSELQRRGSRQNKDYMPQQYSTPNSEYTSQRGGDSIYSDRFTVNTPSNYIRTSNVQIAESTGSTVSNDEFYKNTPVQDYYMFPHQRLGDAATINHFSSSQPHSGPPHSSTVGASFQAHINSGPPHSNTMAASFQAQVNSGPQHSNTMGPPFQTQLNYGPTVQIPMNLSDRHNYESPAQISHSQGLSPLTSSNRPEREISVSLKHSLHSVTPSPSAFHQESVLNQNNSILSQTIPSSVGESELQNSSTLKVQRPSQIAASSGQPAATPPPYTSTPPYRRPENRSPGPRTNRLSSDASSGRVDSPHSITNMPGSGSGSSSIGLSNINRSQSSPCGFHGRKPYSDLPTPREKLSFSDYAEIDHITPELYHGGDLGQPGKIDTYQCNQTSRSGSSSSHIGSASQIGPVYPLGTGSRRHDQSNSSDSRSDIHNYSSSRESPYSGVALYGSAQHSSRQERSYDHFPNPLGTGHFEDLAIIPNQEQSSQVSSSTDSGYGHSHHIYEGISGSELISVSPSQRQMSMKGSDGLHSRDSGHVKGIIRTTPDSTIEQHTDQFHVTIHKNPGLGFSIAGGIGSHGNPYKENDIGIFVTKVMMDGPASKLLRPGDKILEVNKVDFQAIEHNQAVAVLKTCNSVDLLVERIQKVNLV